MFQESNMGTEQPVQTEISTSSTHPEVLPYMGGVDRYMGGVDG